MFVEAQEAHASHDAGQERGRNRAKDHDQSVAGKSGRMADVMGGRVDKIRVLKPDHEQDREAQCECRQRGEYRVRIDPDSKARALLDTLHTQNCGGL
jgi:hypothetical protein